MSSITKRPNGKYRARFRDPAGKEHARHFTRRTDAQQWLASQVHKVTEGTWVDPMAGKRTFGEYAKQWVQAQVHHRDSTTRITKYRLEKHLIPVFGSRPLTSIQRSDVQAWVKSLEVAPSSVEGLYRLLAQVMLAAVDDRLLMVSPCRKINLPGRDEERVLIPTVEQVAAVAGSASPVGRAMVLVAAGTGLRRNELLGLGVEQVDFLRRIVRVDRQLLLTGGFGPPKTKASIREVPVHESLVEVIAAHLAAHPSKDGLVFHTTSGRQWRPSGFGVEWTRWRDKAGVSFRCHDLRHFYASSLIAAGQSVKVVQERLGHASAVTTLDVYGHLFEGDDEATREATGAVLTELLRTGRGL